MPEDSSNQGASRPIRPTRARCHMHSSTSLWSSWSYNHNNPAPSNLVRSDSSGLHISDTSERRLSASSRRVRRNPIQSHADHTKREHTPCHFSHGAHHASYSTSMNLLCEPAASFAFSSTLANRSSRSCLSRSEYPDL